MQQDCHIGGIAEIIKSLFREVSSAVVCARVSFALYIAILAVPFHASMQLVSRVKLHT
jgi:hypothetical protein